jgi:hypothetical protein
MVQRIAWLKKSRARFYQGDIASFEADHVYDIVLTLNMLHHVRDIDRALNNIFSAGRQIVLEIPVTQEEVITRHAGQFAFDLMGKANSHREDREIIIFANPKADIQPSPNPERLSIQLPQGIPQKITAKHDIFSL